MDKKKVGNALKIVLKAEVKGKAFVIQPEDKQTKATKIFKPQVKDNNNG